MLYFIYVIFTQGVTFKTRDGDKTFKGTIATVVADNPASHALGGFKGSSGWRFCRQCMTTSREMSEKV